MTGRSQEQAACRGLDTSEWFPERGDSSKLARRICAGCPVKNECLEESVAAGIRWGIWGGLGEKARRDMIAARHTQETAA